jgi:hypothetical protein
MGFPPPLPPPIPPFKKKKYLSTLFGHLVYTPIERAKGFMIPKMNTLEVFLQWAEREGHPQNERAIKGGTHPLALELICALSMDTEVTMNSPAFFKIKKVLEDSVTDTYPELHYEVVKFMLWGVDAKELPTDQDEELYAEKRISRDGEDFESHDISNFVEKRLRGFS